MWAGRTPGSNGGSTYSYRPPNATLDQGPPAVVILGREAGTEPLVPLLHRADFRPVAAKIQLLGPCTGGWHWQPPIYLRDVDGSGLVPGLSPSKTAGSFKLMGPAIEPEIRGLETTPKSESFDCCGAAARPQVLSRTRARARARERESFIRKQCP